MTEAQFHKSIFGGLGVVLFGFVAYILDRSKSKLRGFSICYGTGLWPWVFVSSCIGLAISVYVFGRNLSAGWIPTFVPFVSVPAAVVLVYGGGWKNAITGGVLGGLFVFPISQIVIEKLLKPWGLPAVIGNVTGMWLGGIIVFQVLKCVPWMKMPSPASKEAPNETTPESPPSPTAWFIRRVLADFSEPQFFGNELASIGLIVGSLASWIMNPAHPAYGTNVFPAVLLSQFLASAIGVYLYYHKYQEYGWYPTFVPVVSVAPAVVLMFGGTIQSVLAGAILGAIVGPPVAELAASLLPKHMHGYIGNTFSMALCTAVIAAMLKFAPGFGLPF